MTKQCTQCSRTFPIHPEDLAFYQRIDVPTPTLCPGCRYQRRLAHRNERTLYQRTCDATGKNIVALYPAKSPYKVYEQSYWRSDAWDARQYGQDFDFSKPFFEQMQALRLAVPRLSLNSPESENSDYTNQSQRLNDCYMVISSGNSERVFHSMWATYTKDSTDVYMAFTSERCYEVVGVNNCYNTRWSNYCDNCTDCYFCYDCRGSSNCFMSTNLRNRSYVWKNEQLTQTEYEHRLSQINFSSYAAVEKLKTETELLWQRQAIHCYSERRKSDQSTGDNLFSTDNVRDCFHVGNSVNSRYCQDGIEMKDCYDCTEVAVDFELNYEVHGAAGVYQSIALNLCSFLKFSAYCDSSFNADYLFGCVGIKRAKHCILNKQYTKAEYDALVPKIIAHMKETGEWGEYWPINTSVYGYNETTAQEYFPLNQPDVITRGWNWQEHIPETHGKETMAWDKIPDTINSIDSSICREVLACKETGKNYKIIHDEFLFYKTMGLPIPRLHPDTRHTKRMALRNPRQLWQRQCMCTQTDHTHKGRCATEFETTYSPERKELVYCEQCYNKEVY